MKCNILKQIIFIFLNFFRFLVNSRVILPKIRYIRELELHIVDNETNEPLPNIKIFFCLEKASLQNIIGDWNFTRIYKNIFVTNDNGKIVIPEESIWFGSFRDLNAVDLYINIDFNEDCKLYYKNLFDKKKDKDIDMLLMVDYFSLYSNRVRNGVKYLDDRYFPVHIHFYDRNKAYVKRQIDNFYDKEDAFESYWFDSRLGTKDKEVIIIKLIKRYTAFRKQNWKLNL